MKLFSPKIKKYFSILFVFLFFFSLVFLFFIQPALARWGVEFFENKEEFITGTEAQPVITRVILYMMDLIAFLSLAFIIFGAIRYVISAGNEQQIAQSKKIILYAIIGLVISILAIVIINAVAGTMGAVGEGGNGNGGGQDVACGTYTESYSNYIACSNDLNKITGASCKCTAVDSGYQLTCYREFSPNPDAHRTALEECQLWSSGIVGTSCSEGSCPSLPGEG